MGGGATLTRFHDNHRGKLIMGTHTFAFFGECQIMVQLSQDNS